MKTRGLEERELRYIYTLSLTLAPYGMGVQLHVLAVFSTRREWATIVQEGLF
jgi:hypothetical protein